MPGHRAGRRQGRLLCKAEGRVCDKVTRQQRHKGDELARHRRKGQGQGRGNAKASRRVLASENGEARVAGAQ